MKGLIVSLAAVATLAAAAAPAAAQDFGRFGGRGGAGSIEARIDRGVRDGSLTPREARSLHERLRDLQRLEWRYGRDGRISNAEARELDRRYADLNRRLFVERRDRDHRGYGWNDRGNGYGGYGYR